MRSILGLLKVTGCVSRSVTDHHLTAPCLPCGFQLNETTGTRAEAQWSRHMNWASSSISNTKEKEAGAGPKKKMRRLRRNFTHKKLQAPHKCTRGQGYGSDMTQGRGHRESRRQGADEKEENGCFCHAAHNSVGPTLL